MIEVFLGMSYEIKSRNFIIRFKVPDLKIE